MRYFIPLLLAGASLLRAVIQVQCFVLDHRSHRPFVVTRQRSALSATSLPVKEGKEVLTFNGDYSKCSEPISGTSLYQISNFFRSNQCRDLFLGSGGQRPVEACPMTPELEQMWIEASEHFHSPCLPEKGNDTLIASDSVIQFPGVKLTTTVYNGVKLLQDEKGRPKYECLLVAEKRKVEGPAPIVWLFKKLTGSEDRSEDEFAPPQGRVKSQVSIVEQDGDQFAFQVLVKFQIVVEFPSLLITLLPTSKAKMEENGTKAVRKTVSKDIDMAVAAARDAFMEMHPEIASSSSASSSSASSS